MNDWGEFCLHEMGGKGVAHSHCWRVWLEMERNGCYMGNHYVVVVVAAEFVVATTVVDAATWNGFGSRFRTSVHSDIHDCLIFMK